MKKYLVFVALLAAFIVSNTYFYRLGASKAALYETIQNMVTLRIQRDCIEKSDMQCIKRSNHLMTSLNLIHIEARDKSSLNKIDKEQLHEYVTWAKTLEKPENSNNSLKSDTVSGL